MKNQRHPQHSDHGLLAITVAFWCSAMAITATAAPRTEPAVGNAPAALVGSTSVDGLHQSSEAGPRDDQPAAPRPHPMGPASSSRPDRSVDDDVDTFRARAQQLLQEERRERRASTLAERFPDHNVVVCEAGCSGPTPEIIYFAPRMMVVAELAPAAASAATSDNRQAETTTDAITCLAGCYDAPKAYRAIGRQEAARMSDEAADRFIRGQGAQPSSGVVHSGRWLTTVTRNEPASASVRGNELRGATSGQWLRRIETTRRARIRRAH